MVAEVDYTTIYLERVQPNRRKHSFQHWDMRPNKIATRFSTIAMWNRLEKFNINTNCINHLELVRFTRLIILITVAISNLQSRCRLLLKTKFLDGLPLTSQSPRVNVSWWVSCRRVPSSLRRMVSSMHTVSPFTGRESTIPATITCTIQKYFYFFGI